MAGYCMVSGFFNEYFSLDNYKFEDPQEAVKKEAADWRSLGKLNLFK
jgi:hypothetical protein